MPFWKCYYHIIWATKFRQPVITAATEPVIYQSIERKSGLLGAHIFAVNSVSDHIHLAVMIPPRLAVAEWVKQLKGISAYSVNQQFPDLPELFKWQEGYGVLTFGPQKLAYVVEYIRNQKAHHADQTIIPALEQIEEPP